MTMTMMTSNNPSRFFLLLLATLTGLALIADHTALAMFPNDCEPSFLSDLSPRFRKVCALLNRMNELSMEIKEYALTENMNRPAPDPHEPGASVKREDIDHVFLRFGKR